jgi:cation transport ATPase
MRDEVKEMSHNNDECDIETLKKMNSLGMAWRVSMSVISALSWLGFFILWLAFYAGDYNVYENIAIIILSVVVFVALNVAIWVPFGMKFAENEPKHKTTGADVVSIIAGVGWLAFLLLWLLMYAGDYDIYQNIAVFVVSLLAFGGISGAAHAVSSVRGTRSP